jgi:hypothetical protein
VATVNNQRITHDELARQCRKSYGTEVLESMVNKQLIVAECERQGVSVSQAEVERRTVLERHHLAHAGIAKNRRREAQDQP